MDESCVYDLFDSLDRLTKGMLKKGYALKKVYHGKVDDNKLSMNHTSNLCFVEKKKGEPDRIIVTGSPKEVYSCLSSFFRGVNLGMSYALKMSSKKLKVEDNFLAHLLHIN